MKSRTADIWYSLYTLTYQLEPSLFYVTLPISHGLMFWWETLSDRESRRENQYKNKENTRYNVSLGSKH